MTATLTPSVTCDDCGVHATGQPNEAISHLRYRLQQTGWETLRMGMGMRDLCVPCSMRRREAAA